MVTNKTSYSQNKHQSQTFSSFYVEMFLFRYKIQARCDKPFMISSLRYQYSKAPLLIETCFPRLEMDYLSVK